MAWIGRREIGGVAMIKSESGVRRQEESRLGSRGPSHPKGLQSRRALWPKLANQRYLWHERSRCSARYELSPRASDSPWFLPSGTQWDLWAKLQGIANVEYIGAVEVLGRGLGK